VAIVACLLALAATLGACGGTSKEDFAEEANEICRDIEQRFQQIGRQEADTPRKAEQQISRVEDAARDAVSRLRDVDRPGGEDGEKAEELVNTLGRQVDQELLPGLRAMREAIRDRNRRALRAALRRLRSVDETRTSGLARELGADDCAG
jgi:hypothetical protein